MCRVGNFNQSQASLTSPEALAALRDLPRSNPALYAELTSGDDEGILLSTIEEPAFTSDSVEDESDIPVEVVVDHLASGSAELADGFRVEDGDVITRTSCLEDPNQDVEEEMDEPGTSALMASVPPAGLGRGHRVHKPSRRLRGLELWEQ
jgi:hypothetical protein